MVAYQSLTISRSRTAALAKLGKLRELNAPSEEHARIDDRGPFRGAQTLLVRARRYLGLQLLQEHARIDDRGPGVNLLGQDSEWEEFKVAAVQKTRSGCISKILSAIRRLMLTGELSLVGHGVCCFFRGDFHCAPR